jgi:hypothetical protein
MRCPIHKIPLTASHVIPAKRYAAAPQRISSLNPSLTWFSAVAPQRISSFSSLNRFLNMVFPTHHHHLIETQCRNMLQCSNSFKRVVRLPPSFGRLAHVARRSFFTHAAPSFPHSVPCAKASGVIGTKASGVIGCGGSYGSAAAPLANVTAPTTKAILMKRPYTLIPTECSFCGASSLFAALNGTG